MSIKIKRQLAPQKAINTRTSGGGNPVNYITLHQTGNTSPGADAQAHANIQSRVNPRQASWQYQVDDKEAIQSFEDDIKCWAAGDGNGPGNSQSVHIEICVNSDGDYRKAVENGAKLARVLLDRHGLSVDHLRQHHDWSRKNCPAQIRANKDGISWTDFKRMVAGEDVKPGKPSNPNKGSYNGNSVVDYLNHKKMDSSFSNRAKLAKQYGIKGYKGTASQNTELLNKLKKGKPVSKPSKSIKVGSKVYLSKSASKYATGENIPSSIKGKTYTVQQVKGNKVLLKEIYSWVYKSDVGGSDKSNKPKSFSVGQKVTVKKSASTFATGESIASFVKGRTYKVAQVKSDRVLLDGIMSWVRKSDVY